MREIRQSGSVRGVRSNPYPYRDFERKCALRRRLEISRDKSDEFVESVAHAQLQ